MEAEREKQMKEGVCESSSSLPVTPKYHRVVRQMSKANKKFVLKRRFGAPEHRFRKELVAKVLAVSISISFELHFEPRLILACFRISFQLENGKS